MAGQRHVSGAAAPASGSTRAARKPARSGAAATLRRAVLWLALTLAPALSLADPAALRLEPPAGGAHFRHPDTTLRIHVPPELPVRVLGQLHLELDRIDVTALVSREGDYAVFKPPRPLAFGTHTLRIVQITDDGREIERGRWKFEVRQSAAFRRLSGSADISANLSYRIAGSDLPSSKPGKLQAHGAARMRGTAVGNVWTAKAKADLLYDTQTANGPPLQLGEYLFSADRDHLGAALGSQSIRQDSLLLQNFHRRGITGHVSSADDSLRATGLLMQTRESPDSANPFGVSKPDQRMGGVVLEDRPLHDRNALYLAMTALSGRYDPQSQGSSVGTPPGKGLPATVAQGSAWGLVIGSQLLQHRLTLHAEAAHSRYDVDGSGSLPRDSDNAWSTRVDWRTRTSGAQPLIWGVGVLRSRIGTFFHTVSNPGLTPDRDLLRGYGSLQWRSWSLQVSGSNTTDNVKKIDILPTDRTREQTAQLGWTPTMNTTAMPWLGAPSVNLQYDRVDQRPKRVPAGYLGTPANQRSTSTGVSANFAHTTWSWGLNYNRDRFKDRTGQSPETVTDAYGVQLSAVLRNRYTVTPYVAYQRTRNLATNESSHNTAANLNIDAQLTDRLRGGLNYSRNNSHDVASAQDQTDWTTDMHLVWNWIQPRANHAGFDLGMSVMYHALNDQLDNSNNYGRWQAFATLAMTLPLRK